MLGKGQSAGTRDDRRGVNPPQFIDCPPEKVGQSFLNISIMPFVIGKGDIVILVEYRDFHSG